MCGISLIYSKTADADLAGKIQRMTQALTHRGPDDCATRVSGHVALGHTRLSIVDIRGGAQPMVTADGRYSIVYNGEIYNYQALRQQLEAQGLQFRTHSDTEVILLLYQQSQEACLRKLRGMFAFAIHDQQTGRLFVARDRLGIKPLYYYADGAVVAAASEIKSLFAADIAEARLNIDSICNYFKYQFAVSPHTVFESVLELPPGHCMTIDRGAEPEIKQYWDLEFPLDGEYEKLKERDWMQRFGDALHDAAASHTIGEVPIRAYLSGGIDSSATSYLLSQHYPEKIQTFTIAFSDENNDESFYAYAVADFLDLPTNELYLDDDREQGFLQDLVSALYHLEQPQRVAVDIPHYLLSGLVQDKHYKVIYTGDGADEILGGYDCYRQDGVRIWGNMQAAKQSRRECYFANFGQQFSSHYLELMLKLHEPQRQEQTIQKFGCYPVWFDNWNILQDVSRRLLSDSALATMENNRQMDELAERMRPQVAKRHPLNQSLYIETKTRLPGWILWKSDRLSMAHGVEARVPFMDHPLVELAAQVPPDLKLNGLDEKYILRKLIMPHLPEHPTQYKKRAFYTPIREWFFTAEHIEQLTPFMSEQAINKAGIFNAQNVSQMLQQISELPKPQTMDDYFAITQLEWGLMLVLTTQILHYLFVERQALCFA